jgi:hypothetical protein
MERVDPADDTIDRWVVFHYRYDPDRRERRWMFDAAFAEEFEMRLYILEEWEDLQSRKAAGEADEKETYKGEWWQAGHDARVALRKQRELARRQRRQERESGGDAHA